MCLHCLGNFAKVRKVMMATTATMIVLNVVIPLLMNLMPQGRKYNLGYIIIFFDLVATAVWITYIVYMSGVLNRLPNGEGYKVLGAELGRIAAGAIVALINLGEIAALINLIVFAYVFFVFKKSEVNDPQELLTACQGCPCTPLPISPGPAQPQGRVVVH